jgi:hypothetical protein
LAWFLFSIRGNMLLSTAHNVRLQLSKVNLFSVVGLLAELRTMRDGDDGVSTWIKKIKKLEGVPFEMPVVLKDAITNLLRVPLVVLRRLSS